MPPEDSPTTTETGRRRYHVRLSIAAGKREDAGPEILHGLANATTLVTTTPPAATIRSGTFDGAVSLTVESALEATHVERALESIDGVESVSIDVESVETPERSGPSARAVFESLRASVDRIGPDAIERELARTSSVPLQCDGSSEPISDADTHEEVLIADLIEDDSKPMTTETDPTADSTDAIELEVATPSSDEDDLLDALLEELESEGGDRRAARLRDALGLESRHSLEARVEHLGTRTETVLAYESALEEFLDSGAIELLETVETRLEDLEETVDRLHDRQERVIAAGADRGERVDALELELEALESDLEEIRTWRERLTAAFDV